MTILVVDEEGRRRGFRVTPGVLSIGSSETASLTLSSPDVAAEHVELDVSDGRVLVRVLPGAVPPLLDGVAVVEPVELSPGQILSIGGARLSLQLEPGEEEPAPDPDAVRPPRAVSAPKRARTRRTGAADSAESTPARSRAARGGSRSRGLPVGVTVLIALGAVAVLGFVFLKFFGAASEQAADPTGASYAAIIAGIEYNLENGEYDRAGERLKRFVGTSGLSAAQRAQIDGLRARLAEAEVGRTHATENLSGTRYLESKLRRFERIYLSGTPEAPAIRVFLKRCAVFLERWPEHEERSWVERQQVRFAAIVDLSEPADYAAIAFEVDAMTRNKPRDYRTAFALLDEFMERATGDDLLLAGNLRARLIPERAEYHMDRMLQARWEHEEGSDSKAVSWLVYGAVDMGDEAMERQAAESLILMPNSEAHLAGYYRERPERYEQMLQNPVLRAFIEEKGLPTSVD